MESNGQVSLGRMQSNGQAEDEAGGDNAIFFNACVPPPPPPPRRNFDIMEALLTIGRVAFAGGFLCILSRMQGDIRAAVKVGEKAVKVGEKIQGDIGAAVKVGEKAVEVGEKAVNISEKALEVGEKAVNISEKALDILDQAATKKLEVGMDLPKGKLVASIRGGYKERKSYKF